MEITRKSIWSGIERTKTLDVTQEQLDRITSGEHIQNVLYHLSEDDREFILSGMTQDEWDECFKDDDE
jgi:hypothetical protein